MHGFITSSVEEAFPTEAAAMFSLFSSAAFLLFLSVAAAPAPPSTFIVLVDVSSKPSIFPSLLHWYSTLSSYSSSSGFPHVYSTVLHGFSCKLTTAEFRRLRSAAGVLAVLPDAILLPQTTHSPAFLGLDFGSPAPAISGAGAGVVVGVVDSGVWPESPSFHDTGDLGPIPSYWKGDCEKTPDFNLSCSGKLVGARSFYAGYLSSPLSVAGDFLSPRDAAGHGTHVATVAAGGPVAGAAFRGFAGGVARGIAPRARIAVYKVCWPAGCLVSDVVAAVDRAVADGVDVLSISLGLSSPAPAYYLDPLAIATFRATAAGVLVVSAAGNGGPTPASVLNAPPWTLSVAAGTMDRRFPAVIVLGDGRQLSGQSITLRRLRRCRLFTAGEDDVAGAIVFLRAARNVSRLSAGAGFREGGAAAMIIAHGDLDPEGLMVEPHVIPTVVVGERQARSIERYIQSTTDPTVAMFSEGTVLGCPAPTVASFSARGPNLAVPTVLKPDILAPGVSVLAAWTGAAGPSGLRSDSSRTGFNIMSGTSMACPHVSGVAALVKAARRHWTPAEIKSALMTSAALPESYGPFEFGAGHVRPAAALDPGLVYSAELHDYVDFFVCKLNYTQREVRIMAGRLVNVPSIREKCQRGNDGGVNYPGFVVEEEAAVDREVVFRRRLKRVNVGKAAAEAVYVAEVAAPDGYVARVEPRKLTFRDGETAEFKLAVRFVDAEKSSARRRRWWGSGYLGWKEEGGNLTVKTPIAVFSSSKVRRLLRAREGQ